MLLGASPNEDKLGFNILNNYHNSNYRGKVYCVNPSHNGAEALIYEAPERAAKAIAAMYKYYTSSKTKNYTLIFYTLLFKKEEKNNFTGQLNYFPTSITYLFGSFY